MLNFVVVSPHFPDNFEPFSLRLNEAGVRVLGLGDEHYDNLSDNLKNALTEYYWVPDMEDYDAMYRGVAYFASKYGRIDRIESHNEYWLQTDARLRTDFNVPGLKIDEMDSLQKKSEMKKTFKKAKVPVAKGRVFNGYIDGLGLIKELKYPVIVKPDRGVGASDTWKINNKEDYEEFFKERDENIDYIMEEYIPGDIVTFDGLTDQNGEIVFYSSLVHNVPVLDVVDTEIDMNYHIPREIPNELVEIGTKMVEAFDIKERFFHFELFKLKDDSYVALELNCRPPGGYAVDVINYANDIDIFREYANIVVSNEFKAEVTRPYYCIYISRKNINDYVHSEEEIYQKYGHQIVNRYQMPQTFASVQGDYGYIYRSEDIEEMKDFIRFVSKKTN